MTYDFDTVIDRRHTHAIKYNTARKPGMPADALPLWVADMDFAAPPEVLQDLQKAVTHGIFGYSEPKADYYDALTRWFSERFGWAFAADDVVKSPGVVFALAAAVRAFTRPGDAVLIQTPVYYPFYLVIREGGRRLVSNPLRAEKGVYNIDFDDFEDKIRSEKVRLFILCSPHNPIGRVWTRDELEAMSAICRRHGVRVLSDEVHCDFVWPGHRHTAFGLIDEEAVIATAPSKTFNLAGLQASNIIVRDGVLRAALQAEIARAGYSQLNTLGLIACQSAYTHGGAWLAQLAGYLAENIRFARAFLAERLPAVGCADPQGTYLLWLDFSAYGLEQAALDRRMAEDAKLWLSSGTAFGREGEGFQRVNVACPRATLEEALGRMARAFA